MRSTLAVVSLACAAVLPAQNVFHGNGIPSAYLTSTPAVIGRALTFGVGSPTAPNGLGALAVSGGLGPFFVPHPLVGNIGIDPTSPFFFTLLMFLDGNGDSSLTLPIGTSNGPATPPFYATAFTLEPGPLFSFTKTVSVDWANPNSWEAPAPLATARQLHTATALGNGPRDNVTEVLICGGATGSIIVPIPLASAELYTPLTRSVSPLPNLAMPRASHRAVRLLDGRVLISGGVTTGGRVTATCEFFDPATSTFVAAPTMAAPRAGHALTLLLDGRVLASGGVADWQNAASSFIAALNTAQNSAELFDPATNTWSPLPAMASRRLGHSQTLLLDGRVLVASGIAGGNQGTNSSATNGQVPFYTTNCEIFDPTTGTFTPTAAMPVGIAGGVVLVGGRGFHGASLLPNGNVLVTGGFVPNVWSNSEALPTAECWVWNGVTWNSATSLPVAVAMHSQIPFRTGALVTGGFVGDLQQLYTTQQNVLVDAAGITPLTPIPASRAAHSATLLHDGTVLIYGGGVWPATLGDGRIYTGN
jgi:hypothetical protein